jgi:uncharacterized protein
MGGDVSTHQLADARDPIGFRPTSREIPHSLLIMHEKRPDFSLMNLSSLCMSKFKNTFSIIPKVIAEY